MNINQYIHDFPEMRRNIPVNYSSSIPIRRQKRCSTCLSKEIRIIDPIDEEYWCNRCQKTIHIFIETRGMKRVLENKSS